MPLLPISLGSAPDAGDGIPLREALALANANFAFLESAILERAPLAHVHDARYYQRSEVDALLEGLELGETGISDVDGLQAALDAKANASHAHTISDVTGLQAALDAKAAASHAHTISDVTGLQAALDAKAASAHTHAWADVTGKPSSFTPASHSHDLSDVNGLQSSLADKADSEHAHAISDVTGLQAALDAKAASSHAHAVSDVTGLSTQLASLLEPLYLNPSEDGDYEIVFTADRSYDLDNVRQDGSGSLSYAKKPAGGAFAAASGVTAFADGDVLKVSVTGFDARLTLAIPRTA